MLKKVVIGTSLVASLAAPPRPVYSEQFTTHLMEYDDTSQIVSVHQTLAFDIVNRRSHMTADGALVQNGHLEEWMRCDAPNGFSLNAFGAEGSEPERCRKRYRICFADSVVPPLHSWQCTNNTLNPDPADCVFQPFWTMPENATYEGKDAINGTQCDKWSYWIMNDLYAQWLGETHPLRIAKTFTPNPDYHLWHIDVTSFKDYKGTQGVPLPSFVVPAGIHNCSHDAAVSPSSPPSLSTIMAMGGR